MTRHPTVFEVERPVRADDIVKDLQLDTHNKSSVGESAHAAAPGKNSIFARC